MGIRADEAVNISALLIQALDSESADPDEADKPPNPDDVTKRLRKRMTRPPKAIFEKQPPKNPAVVRGDGDLSSANSEASYTSS